MSETESKERDSKEYDSRESWKPSSYAWRGPAGSGKRMKLHQFLSVTADRFHLPFEVKEDTWFVNKQTEEEDTGKSIPYEESMVHLGFDVARMSMSDKIFLQSILSRWTGQQDLCLLDSHMQTRYLVLYHAHLLTDESVLQLQEALEQYDSFAILLTTELPVCHRLRDFCMEIPVSGKDHLLEKYCIAHHLPTQDVWFIYFQKTLEAWSVLQGKECVVHIRNWIYTCLQRNLRWTDVIMYWIKVIYRTPWLLSSHRMQLLEILWRAESGAGWLLVTSYRIPMMWEHVHLQFARTLQRMVASLPSLPFPVSPILPSTNPVIPSTNPVPTSLPGKLKSSKKSKQHILSLAI